MLAALAPALLGLLVGSTDLDRVRAAGAQIRAHLAYEVAVVLVLLGALTKSAQFSVSLLVAARNGRIGFRGFAPWLGVSSQSARARHWCSLECRHAAP